MLLLALLTSPAQACAMAYGGAEQKMEIQVMGPSIVLSGLVLDDLFAAINGPQTPAERFLKKAPPLDEQLPERAPSTRRPVS